MKVNYELNIYRYFDDDQMIELINKKYSTNHFKLSDVDANILASFIRDEIWSKCMTGDVLSAQLSVNSIMPN